MEENWRGGETWDGNHRRGSENYNGEGAVDSNSQQDTIRPGNIASSFFFCYEKEKKLCRKRKRERERERERERGGLTFFKEYYNLYECSCCVFCLRIKEKLTCHEEFYYEKNHISNDLLFHSELQHRSGGKKDTDN